MKYKKSLQLFWGGFLERVKDKVFAFLFLNAAIVGFQILYVFLRKMYLNPTIPLWYTRFWGNLQLAPKSYILIIPVCSLTILAIGLFLIIFMHKFYIRYLVSVITVFTVILNVLLTYQLLRIFSIASIPHEPLINPLYLDLLFPFVASFLCVYFVLPIFISFAEKKGLVTNPAVHKHPGMLLVAPSARGGGFVYAIVFLVLSLFFGNFNASFAVIYIGVLMLGVLGLMDDYQNTHIFSRFKIVENPMVRFFLLVIAVLPVAFAGIRIGTITNPFGGAINLDTPVLTIWDTEVFILSIIVTTLWIVWILNVLSWSNGVDGQYSGIVGISSIIIAILALRFVPIESVHKQQAVLAAISAGAALGFVKYTWHPSKIMWGFGAMVAGFVIASLSILTKTKITVSVLIILIPFLDALVTVLRRILQGKNPLKGDRGHLHHLLLDRGWSVKKVSLFYWVTTAIFGIIALLASEKYIMQIFFLLMGLCAFVIILMNVTSVKINQPKVEKDNLPVSK